MDTQQKKITGLEKQLSVTLEKQAKLEERITEQNRLLEHLLLRINALEKNTSPKPEFNKLGFF